MKTKQQTSEQLEAIALIEKHGGSASFARLLGFQGAKGTIRVNNWKTRGIPWEIKFKHPRFFSDEIQKNAA